MNEPRVNRKTAATVLAVALILAGFGSVRAEKAVDSPPWLTRGHTQYLDLDEGQSGCFAGLAGLLMQRVTWFNGQPLFEQAVDGGDTWIYVTEHLNDRDSGFDEDTGIEPGDPSRETLYDTGNEYELNVPTSQGQEKTWVVKELFALRDEKINIDQTQGVDGPKEKVYVWVVNVDSKTWDQTLQRYYNFALVVDTCKFHTGPDRETGEHNNTDGEGDPTQPQNQHDPNDIPGTHTHGEFMSDVWIGGPPDISPIPTGQVEGNGSGSGDSGSGGDAS